MVTDAMRAYSRFCYYAFKMSSAALVGFLVPCAARVMLSSEQIFIQSTILLHLSGLAVYFYPLTLNADGTASRSGPAWTIGLGGLAVANIMNARNPSWFSDGKILVGWRSVRTLLGLGFLLIIVLFAALLTFSGICVLDSGRQWTTMLLLAMMCWFAGNWVATWVAFCISQINKFLPYPVLMQGEDVDSVTFTPLRNDIFCAEISDLIKAYNVVVAKSNALIGRATMSNRERTFATMAAQMAHDVRSPLAALKMMLSELGQVEEDIRILARTAVFRIEDIANQLLIDQRTGLRTKSHDAPVTEVMSLVEQIVSEKRFQFRANRNIVIEASLDASTYGLFVSVSSNKIQRVLSNLINNAVESKGCDRVCLLVSHDAEQVSMVVKDNGAGIADTLFMKLNAGIRTSNKSGGYGLGLSHASSVMDECGGKLQIDSALGQGAAITLIMPSARQPLWFMPHLPLRKGQPVVVLDDDASIHEIWKKRLDGFEIYHCLTANDFRKAFERVGEYAFFLVDYELVGEQSSGLDLIIEFAVASRSAVVTSHHAEPSIQNRCEEAGLRIVPKLSAAHISVVS